MIFSIKKKVHGHLLFGHNVPSQLRECEGEKKGGWRAIQSREFVRK